jgi:hypothetical protein
MKEPPMSRRTVRHASGRHRSLPAVVPPRVHAHPAPSLEDQEVVATLGASVDESLDIEVRDRNDRITDATMRWRGARRDSWDADEDRAEVDRFLRDHFTSDELEVA